MMLCAVLTAFDMLSHALLRLFAAVLCASYAFAKSFCACIAFVACSIRLLQLLVQLLQRRTRLFKLCFQTIDFSRLRACLIRLPQVLSGIVGLYFPQRPPVSSAVPSTLSTANPY